MRRPIKVLVVDDDRVTLACLEELVARLGGAATGVADAASARVALAAGTFDLVICDLRLPDASGATLVAGNRDAVFVATSAHVDAALARQLRRIGFASVIEKPVSPGVLAALVEQHFGQRAHDGVADSSEWRRDAGASAQRGLRLVDPGRPGYRVTVRIVEPMLDDDAARIACGSDEVVAALRKLLGDELRRSRVHIRQALRTRRPAVAREALHKLAASCALVGAVPLRAATIALMGSVDSGLPDRRVALAFDRLAGRTLVALKLPRT